MLLAERLRKPEERAEVQQALSLLIKQVTLTLALTLALTLTPSRSPLASP